MSSTPVTLRNAIDTWCGSAVPTLNHTDEKRLALNSGTDYAFLHFNRPFPLGATIVSATLRVYTAGSWGTTPTLTVKRANAGWKASKVVYNTMPGVVGTAYTLSHSSAVDGDEWAIDITGMMQTVSNGGAWYGVRIETTDSSRKWLYSADAVNFRPTLDIVWSEAPNAPTTLSPSGGRSTSIAKPVLRFDFTDDLGSTALSNIQVQMNATNVWTDPTFDTGTYPSTEPELDLSTYTLSRSVTVTKTSGTPGLSGITAGTMAAADIGATITGTGIPGGTTITAATIGGTTATMSANASSSGTITATITRTHPGLVNATAYYWRVRVQDGSGLWSPWSDASILRRDNKGTLTITNPAAGGSPFVNEWTPPFGWNLTTTTQVAYQVQLALTSDPTGILYDSGRIKGTAVALTPPKGILVDGSTYRLTVKIWDTIDREATPGDPAYTILFRDFTVNEAATAPITGLTATPDNILPWVTLDFARSTAPDYFVVKRDGTVIEDRIVPSDIFVSGTSYRYKDKDSKRGVSHTWIVQAVVSGLVSGSGTPNPSIAATTGGSGIWLSDNQRDIQLLIVGAEGSTWSAGESADSWTPLGSTQGIRVTQGIRGWEGTVSGVLVDLGNKTVDQWADNALKIRSRPGQVCTLHAGRETFRCVVFNLVVAPVGANVTMRPISFDFMQVGAQTYTPRL